MEREQDISDGFLSGVYVLRRRGAVVFVGRSKCMLTAIATHRTSIGVPRVPEWFPLKGIRFDQVSIIPMAYTRTQAYATELIELYQPVHNIYSGPTAIQPPSPPTPITRRAL